MRVGALGGNDCFRPKEKPDGPQGIHYGGASCLTYDVEKCILAAQNQAPAVASCSLITTVQCRTQANAQ